MKDKWKKILGEEKQRVEEVFKAKSIEEENKKVEYSRTWYDADAARYVSRLK